MLMQKLDKPQIRSQPLGTVLIIGAWNYPIQLVVVGLVGAIAAGNTAILKPSELSENTAQILADLLPQYLDPECVKVVNGAIPESTVLLRLRFDHIMYTGNSQVARIVMRAAAEHLTPVTLELGGKSPVVVDEDVDVRVTARRIVWGRFMNCGQTCIAPDYVLCSKKMEKKLVAEMKSALQEFYGDNPRECKDYCRIVHPRHFRRIRKLLDDTKCTIAIGGKVMDEKDRYFEPTVVTDLEADSPLMTNEVFGPILPIYNVANVDDAIEFINSRNKPLALYVFSNTSSVVERVVESTSSGGVVANDTLMHASCDSLPFGGVGESGMGGYHGKHTFDTFSHKRAVMIKDLGMEAAMSLRYPPYTDRKWSILRFLALHRLKSGPPYKKIAGVVLLFGVLWAIVSRYYPQLISSFSL
jgi:aldehyde dehydrogenase (NAD+)